MQQPGDIAIMTLRPVKHDIDIDIDMQAVSLADDVTDN